jgi:hypothetical protein
VRSPVSDSPPPLPGAGASVASLSASRRASLKRGGPASLYHGAVSVGQAAYGETTRSLSCECQFSPLKLEPVRRPFRVSRIDKLSATRTRLAPRRRDGNSHGVDLAAGPGADQSS